MSNACDESAGERRRRRGALRLAGAVFAILLLQPAGGWAAILWNVEKLVASHATTAPGTPVALVDGTITSGVRVEYLRALLDAHRRLGEVSKVNAELALVVDRAPNAKAYFGQRLIVVTSGMLEIIGADAGMIAALLSHEFAHLSLRHAVQRVLNLPNLVYGGVAVMSAVSQRTNDNNRAAAAGQMAIGLMAASFSRKQESEADKVGVEFLARAKYDPDSALRLLDTFVKLTGGRAAGYLDSHPGFQERLANAAPTVMNQQYDAVAADLAAQKRWKNLGALVDQWLQARPDSAGGWYYRGLALRGQRRAGALAAFEKSAAYDANFTNGRLELCVEYYRQGRERESILCSEYLPRGEVQEEYEARTFQHPVIVGGFAPRPGLSALGAQVIEAVAKVQQAPPVAPPR